MKEKKVSSREIEGKFKVDNLESIRKNIKKYIVEEQVTTREDNRISVLWGLLERRGAYIRLRNNGNYYFTFKGPNKSSSIMDRFEFNQKIPEWVYILLKSLLPEKVTYKKTSQLFSSEDCQIFLDLVEGLGTFVEIEAPTEEQVTLWKKRLGITSKSIQKPYYKLVG